MLRPLKKLYGWIASLLKRKKTNRLDDESPSSFVIYRALESEDTELADEAFEILRLGIYERIYSERDQTQRWEAPSLFTERGFLEASRPYFFLKPKDQTGWLFERSSQGWVISRCSKITSQDTFMRSYEPWDTVTLYTPQLPLSSLRVHSQQIGEDIVSFPVYQKLLIAKLEEDFVLPAMSYEGKQAFMQN